jgi:hypothetical protein
MKPGSAVDWHVAKATLHLLRAQWCAAVAERLGDPEPRATLCAEAIHNLYQAGVHVAAGCEAHEANRAHLVAPDMPEAA